MSKGLHFEVRVRAYYTSDQADVVPTTTVLCEHLGADGVKLNIGELLDELAAQMPVQSFTNLRPMSEAECKAHRAGENDDDE